jgi:hypothetical protein
MLILILWLFFAFLMGAWAQHRGRSGGGWGLLALLISPLLAFIILLAIGPNHEGIESGAIASGEMRKCPQCAELVKAEAKLCRYCHTSLPRGIFQS